MKYENKIENDTNDSTEKIVTESEKKNLNDITTKWTRHCPKCNKEIIYKDKYNCSYASLKNTNCMSCNATGKKHNVETIEKIKNKNINKKVSFETREKLSKINTGKKLSNNTRLKIKSSLIGNKRMLGKHHTTTTKQKISTSLKGKMCGIKNPRYGKVGANKGKKFSFETRRRMSQSRG